MKFIFLILVLLFAQQVNAQRPFKIPDASKRVDVEYLRNFKVPDPSQHLNDAEKRDLCRLFVRAYVFSIRERRQDYSLPSDTPLYILLATNFPEVRAREGEGGRVIFLGAITGFFNAKVEYRADVIQALKEDRTKAQCR
jgi:hypothetical protein